MTDEAQTPPTPDLSPSPPVLPGGATLHEQIKRMGVALKKATAKIEALTEERDELLETGGALLGERDKALVALAELTAAVAAAAAESPEADALGQTPEDGAAGVGGQTPENDDTSLMQ